VYAAARQKLIKHQQEKRLAGAVPVVKRLPKKPYVARLKRKKESVEFAASVVERLHEKKVNLLEGRPHAEAERSQKLAHAKSVVVQPLHNR